MIEQRYGPWAVVTGASSGLGKAFAHHLARAGLNVVLASRSTDRLHAIGLDLATDHGIDHRVVGVDLSAPDGAQALLAATADLDVGLLVSNAGDSAPRDFLDQPIEALHRQVRLNAISHLDLARHFGEHLVQRGAGGIILTSATGGFHGMPHMANDAAAKGYVHHLGEALHHELAPAGVDVTVLMPGNVDTPLVARLGFEPSDFPLSLMSAEAAVSQAMRALASGRVRIVPGRALRTVMRLVPRAASVRLNGRLLARAMARTTTRAADAAPAA